MDFTKKIFSSFINKKHRCMPAIFLLALILSGLSFSSCVVPAGDLDIQQGARYFQKKKFDEARHCFEMALEEECTFPKESVYIYISNCYSQQEDYDSAIEWREKALEISPDADNLLQLGMIYRVKLDDDKAEEYFKKALELNTRNAAAYASLGSLYMTHNRTDEAIEMLENSLDINNLSSIVHADLAVCYARKGMEKEAMDELQWAADHKFEQIAEFKDQVISLLNEFENDSE